MKNLMIIFLIAITMASCTERIDIELDDTYTRLVVEGEVTTDTIRQKVSLTKTTSYYYSEKAPGISGALVTLSDGDTTYILAETENGVYLSENTFAGIPGKTYKLDIVLSNPINNETHYSAESMLHPIGTIDSVSVEYVDRWDSWEVQLWAWDPPSTDYYKFDIVKNGVLITDTLNEPFVVDDILYNGNFTNGIGVGYLWKEYEDEFVNKGDTITCIMSVITEEYCKYLWAIQTEAGYRNPLFSGPPANVEGNISNGALGFFIACSKTSKSTIYQ